MQLIDTHSHIDVHHFDTDRHEVLKRSRQASVILQILPGVCEAWWTNLLTLCQNEKDLLPAIGLHPMYLHNHHPDHLNRLQQEVNSGKVVAIGEIGLDYFIKEVNHRQQEDLFTTQLQLAKRYDLPVLLHARKAHDQVQSIIRRMNFQRGGIIHAFSGSLQQAMHYIQLGFKISFGGTITYDRATRIRGVARELTADAMVLETDAPDIPPVSQHGKRNSPEHLPEILRALAKVHRTAPEELARQTTANAISVLGLDTTILQEFPS